FFVTLKPWGERETEKTSLKSIMGSINKRLGAMPEARAFAFTPPAIPGIGTASGFSFMLQDRAGNTLQDLEAQADLFMQAAKKRPEIAAINTTFSAKIPQIFVSVDRE